MPQKHRMITRIKKTKYFKSPEYVNHQTILISKTILGPTNFTNTVKGYAKALVAEGLYLCVCRYEQPTDWRGKLKNK